MNLCKDVTPTTAPRWVSTDGGVPCRGTDVTPTNRNRWVSTDVEIRANCASFTVRRVGTDEVLVDYRVSTWHDKLCRSI